MIEEPQARSRTNRGLIALTIILIIALGAVGVYTFNINFQLQEVSKKLSDLNEDQAQLNSRLSQISQSQTTLTQTQVVVTETKIVTESKVLNISYTSIVSEIFDQVKESVVAIIVRVPRGVGQGSGFVYDSNGDIVTNNHVVEGAEEIVVAFLDGTMVEAKIVATDRFSDLAVVKVDPSKVKLKPLTLGDSSTLKVGEPIIAIGSPFGLSGTVTTGVVSQTGRIFPTAAGFSIPSVIQIDAAINPGNSGGPLLNYNGEVVGVTSAIESETGTFSGIGFAIPSNTVTKVVKALIEVGYYKHSWIGISGIDMTPALAELMKLNITKGFMIIEVFKDSPAEKAGLRGATKEVTVDRQRIPIGGDVIIGLDDVKVRRLDDILVYLEDYTRPGQTVKFVIIRGGVEMTIPVVVGERPTS